MSRFWLSDTRCKTDGTELGRVVCLHEDVVLKSIPAQMGSRMLLYRIWAIVRISCN